MRTDNEPAIALYRSAGFVEVGLRKRYYRVSGADAYTMRRDASEQVTDDRPGHRELLRRDRRRHRRSARHGEVRLLADEVASSVDEHARFGGVVPEVASRAHLEALVPTMRRALAAAGIARPDAVAVTIGPGLAGALLVGVAAAKAYAAAWDVPFYAVNHLGGHVAVDIFDHGPLPQCVGAAGVRRAHPPAARAVLGEPIIELGTTVDDAAGEAYDKVARLLGLGYPGGPVLDELARTGDREAMAFPRGMTGPRDDPYSFSFSGLKTAVARYLQPQPDYVAADVAAGFQEAVADVLTAKAVRAATELGRRHAADRRRGGGQLAAA